MNYLIFDSDDLKALIRRYLRAIVDDARPDEIETRDGSRSGRPAMTNHGCAWVASAATICRILQPCGV